MVRRGSIFSLCGRTGPVHV